MRRATSSSVARGRAKTPCRLQPTLQPALQPLQPTLQPVQLALQPVQLTLQQLQLTLQPTPATALRRR